MDAFFRISPETKDFDSNWIHFFISPAKPHPQVIDISDFAFGPNWSYNDWRKRCFDFTTSTEFCWHVTNICFQPNPRERAKQLGERKITRGGQRLIVISKCMLCILHFRYVPAENDKREKQLVRKKEEWVINLKFEKIEFFLMKISVGSSVLKEIWISFEAKNNFYISSIPINDKLCT